MSKTPEQIAAQKQRWYGKRDKIRRKRYHEDPNYREDVKARSREWARKANGTGPLRSCDENLERLDEIGKERPVLPSKVTMLTFTMQELGEALGGYKYQCMSRWVSKRMIPEPVFTAELPMFGYETAEKGTRVAGVYLEDEVRAMIGVFSGHQRNHAHFRASHTEVIDAINVAVEQARSALT